MESVLLFFPLKHDQVLFPSRLLLVHQLLHSYLVEPVPLVVGSCDLWGPVGPLPLSGALSAGLLYSGTRVEDPLLVDSAGGLVLRERGDIGFVFENPQFLFLFLPKLGFSLEINAHGLCNQIVSVGSLEVLQLDFQG